jgi:hypothetical protein
MMFQKNQMIPMIQKNTASAPKGSSMSRVRLFVVGALGLMAFAACVATEDAPAFFLKGNAAVTQQEQCVARPNPRTLRSYGTLDAWMRNRYKMFPIVQSYLTPTAESDLYGEVNNVQFIGVTVTYDFPSNLDAATEAVLDKEYFHVMAGSVLAGEPGVAIVDVIQPEVGNALANESFVDPGFEIVVNITAEGRLSDGTIVHSNTMYYPINVCWKCLYMEVTDDCTDLSDSQDMRPPCLLGQDDGVDCRLFETLGMPVGGFSGL